MINHNIAFATIKQHSQSVKKTLYGPFHGWGSTVSRLKPLRGGSFLFTTKFPEIPVMAFLPPSSILRTSGQGSLSINLENVRKSLVFSCLLGVQKENTDMKCFTFLAIRSLSICVRKNEFQARK